MESHRPDILCFRAKQGRQPVLDLVGGLVGKGDGNDAPGYSRLHRTQGVGAGGVLIGRLLPQPFQKFHIFILNMGRDLLAVASAAIAHEVGNSVDQHGGFSAARTGQQQQRPLGSEDGLLLHVVQLRKPGGNVFLPRGNESGFHLFCHSVHLSICKMLLFYFIFVKR